MQEQTTSGYRHGHQGLPHYTSQAGGVVVSPSYMDYMASYSPKPPPYWAPPPSYSQCVPPPYLLCGVPPSQQSQGPLSQLEVTALPTYEEAMRAQQPIKTELSNSNSSA